MLQDFITLLIITRNLEDFFCPLFANLSFLANFGSCVALEKRIYSPLSVFHGNKFYPRLYFASRRIIVNSLEKRKRPMSRAHVLPTDIRTRETSHLVHLRFTDSSKFDPTHRIKKRENIITIDVLHDGTRGTEISRAFIMLLINTGTRKISSLLSSQICLLLQKRKKEIFPAYRFRDNKSYPRLSFTIRVEANNFQFPLKVKSNESYQHPPTLLPVARKCLKISFRVPSRRN